MKKLKITALITAIALLIPCIALFAVSAATNEGATFTDEDLYFTNGALSKLPSTYEATVKFPEGTDSSTRGGVILGDFYNMTTACYSFEIHKNGNPRLYFIDASKKTYSFIFTDVDVYTGEWVHIAIVKNSAAETITCYVNGVAQQTLYQASPASLTLKSATCLGGDNRPANEQYFKGSIKNVAIYSDIRTADELKTDATGTYDKDNLIAFYEVTQGAKTIKDTNGVGPTLSSRNPWFEKEAASDYAYSIAVVGDTQTLNYYYQDKMVALYNWILNHVDEKKIEYVIGLGDITDKDQVGEWTLAKNLLKMFDGIVPYSIVRGNHDSVEKMNRFFPYSDYSSKISGSFDETMLNTYHTFEIGNVRYLLLNLDMGPSDEVLEWANKVVSENPDRNVIVATHVYLYHDGTTLDKNDNAAASNCGGINDGDDIWEKFVKKHENIVLVLSGHDPYDQIVTTQTKGEKGNTVTQMLIDPQHTDKTYGGAGLVAMLYFSEDGSHVDVEYISTVHDAYFMEENQFSIDLQVVEASATPIDTQAETTETAPESEENPEETTANKNGEKSGFSFDFISFVIGAVAGLAIGGGAVYAFTSKKKKN